MAGGTTALVAPGVYAYALKDLDWTDTPRAGVREKVVRRDDATGDYFGLVSLAPMSETGLHQHLGTAFAYFMSGSLLDYWGPSHVGSIGVNLAGATHAAVTYEGCVLVSRLEGPVIVPPDAVRMHPSAGNQIIRNEKPETAPDIEIFPESVFPVPTRFPGVMRRMLFDYTPTPHDWRLSKLTFFPRCPSLRVKHTELSDWFVMAGDLRIGNGHVSGPTLVTIEPGAEVELSSEHGCAVLAWAEGPAFGVADEMAELYGFR